jgi:quinol monooxygenase YgiN
MPDPSHLLIARVHGVAARSAELRAAAQELADASAGQDGCLAFDVLTVAADASELVLLSAWRSDRELRAHFSSGPPGATSPPSPTC